jgi:hypothetical protein
MRRSPGPTTGRHNNQDGQENAMPNERNPTPSEDEIRTRSYLLWERDGCRDGNAEEYWQRAKAELEAELEANWHAASMEGETTAFVLPVLPIATPPVKSVAVKLAGDDSELKKAAG